MIVISPEKHFTSKSLIKDNENFLINSKKKVKIIQKVMDLNTSYNLVLPAIKK